MSEALPSRSIAQILLTEITNTGIWLYPKLDDTPSSETGEKIFKSIR